MRLGQVDSHMEKYAPWPLPHTKCKNMFGGGERVEERDKGEK
jgi:hypothetical protein